jgi:hypothetical protein
MSRASEHVIEAPLAYGTENGSALPIACPNASLHSSSQPTSNKAEMPMNHSSCTALTSVRLPTIASAQSPVVNETLRILPGAPVVTIRPSVPQVFPVLPGREFQLLSQKERAAAGIREVPRIVRGCRKNGPRLLSREELVAAARHAQCAAGIAAHDSEKIDAMQPLPIKNPRIKRALANTRHIAGELRLSAASVKKKNAQRPLHHATLNHVPPSDYGAGAMLNALCDLAKRADAAFANTISLRGADAAPLELEANEAFFDALDAPTADDVITMASARGLYADYFYNEFSGSTPMHNITVLFFVDQAGHSEPLKLALEWINTSYVPDVKVYSYMTSGCEGIGKACEAGPNPINLQQFEQQTMLQDGSNSFLLVDKPDWYAVYNLFGSNAAAALRSHHILRIEAASSATQNGNESSAMTPGQINGVLGGVLCGAFLTALGVIATLKNRALSRSGAADVAAPPTSPPVDPALVHFNFPPPGYLSKAEETSGDSGHERNVHTAEFKAKVGLEALRSGKKTSEIAQSYGVRSQQVREWKKQIINSADTLFVGEGGPAPAEDE